MVEREFRGHRITPVGMLELAMSELWCWIEAGLRWLPGRSGRGVRSMVYAVFIGSHHRVYVSDYALGNPGD